MKAMAIERNGGPEVLTLHDLPVPEVKPGDVLVKLDAVGINFIDVYFRSGAYKVPAFPYVLGLEGAGVVESVGAGVDGFAVGDRVASVAFSGAYAEYAVVSAERVVKIPDGVETSDAAALMLQGMTAHYLCTSTFPLEKGQIALVHAGAGGVGLLLTQLAKARGATVISTVSTDEKAALSKRAGADHVINYTETDFAEEVRRISDGAGVHVAYDSVGKTTWEKSLGSLRPRGYFVLYGASSGPVPPFDLQLLAQKGSLFATRPTLVNYSSAPDELRRRAGELFAAVLDGTLALRMEHTYPLADAAQAHTDLEARKTTGKLLLLP